MAITTSKGSYQDYAYTGGMQSVAIPHDGIYKFEVWGAGGSNSALHGSGNYGNNYNTNGKGGYSVGYKLCKKGEVYYICVGGCNNPYNGGGRGNAGWGGGATHIATKTGELKNLSGDKAAVLLVAGGGGGTGQANGEAARAAAGTAAAMAEHRLDPVQAEAIKGLSDKADKATGIGQMAA
ncbi:MAG: glycine-rich protein [Christensenellales bacterium]